jgi:hypothetical protein
LYAIRIFFTLTDSLIFARAREAMPPSKKKRGQAAGRRPAGVQLLDAAAEGDAAGVMRLLAAGADPNVSLAWGAGRNASDGEAFQTNALGAAQGC